MALTTDTSPYAPLDWQDFFETKRTVPIPADLDPSSVTFCVYEINRGETTSKEQHNLHVERLAKDLQNLIMTLYGPESEDPVLPELFLVGHSMGGSVVAEFAMREMASTIVGFAVLDMLQVNLAYALVSIKFRSERRPPTFDSIEQAVQYGVDSGTVRNIESARISFPGMITRAPSSLCPSTSSTSTNTTTYIWRTNLLTSEPYWHTWFEGQNHRFLGAKARKLLILAEHNKLDEELQAAYDNGMFEFLIFDGAGHAVQEDQPERLAKELVMFWKQKS
ncbi:hypothetical protein BGX28_007304 [Mortierella sp. GBA30]|nr:hypothetical protein BGX28_007304 [Mortierella sp. GBA30]